MRRIYLDNNATTRPDDRVTDAVLHAHRELWANPSSVHRFGQQVRQRLELARRSVADLLHAQPREIIFTSGGTESNNLALRGVAPDVLITTRVEHSAVTAPAQAMQREGVTVRHVEVDARGLINIDHLDALLDEHAAARVLVSIQWANNETGVLQPIGDITARVKPRKALLHTDATQAVGKVPVDLSAVTGVDLLTLSAHKFHGPKGVGALFVRRGVRLRAQQHGGPQEREQRGGTENVPGVIGLGVAADLAGAFLADAARTAQLRALRDRFEQRVRNELADVTVNPPDAGVPRLWNTSNLAFPGLAAEGILVALSERGVCASAGAACSSGSLEPSPVLLAMGIDEPAAHGSVRFSLSRESTGQDVDEAVEQIVRVVRKLGEAMPVARS